MKTIIFYFSGTGNSLAVAKGLAKELGECKLISMSKSLKSQEFNFESKKLGFIFPNYFGKVPKLVNRFIEKVNIKDVKYVFSLVTAGGITGVVFRHLNSILQKKNWNINLYSGIVLPGNYIIAFYYAMTNGNEKEKDNMFAHAKIKIKKLADIINNDKNSIENSDNPFMAAITGLFNIPNNLSKIEIWDKNYNVDEKCNSCEICVKICPVSNIQLIEKRPHWQNNCQMCMACIQNCPQQAIQYKNQTREKLRYRHPEVTVNELINGPQLK